MKVGIVMPCINLWEKCTKPAIDSVAGAMGQAILDGVVRDPDIQFLLIDNASTDETQREATEMFQGSQHHLEYHRNEERWGFQRSVNYGVNYFLKTGCDYVLVLNNDITLHPQAIVQLVERMQKGGVGMTTCLDIRGEMDEQKIEPKDIEKMSVEEKEACAESPHPNFSAFMVSALCWEQVGEFDELFYPAYYEDNDYHYRMTLAGLVAITHPKAMFYHYGSRTQNEALGHPLTESGNQHAQYVRKWGGDPGKEQYTTPFNDPTKDVLAVHQRQ